MKEPICPELVTASILWGQREDTGEGHLSFGEGHLSFGEELREGADQMTHRDAF